MRGGNEVTRYIRDKMLEAYGCCDIDGQEVPRGDAKVSRKVRRDKQMLRWFDKMMRIDGERMRRRVIKAEVVGSKTRGG